MVINSTNINKTITSHLNWTLNIKKIPVCKFTVLINILMVCRFLWVKANLCKFFLSFVYTCCWRFNYQDGSGIPLTSLICHIVVPVPSQVWISKVTCHGIFFMFSVQLRWEVIILLIYRFAFTQKKRHTIKIFINTVNLQTIH
jgi:hypothetical protein